MWKNTAAFLAQRTFVKSIMLSLVVLFGFASFASASEANESDRIARIAMSTASLWMMEHHEHEIVEGIEEGNLQEARHEAEELIPWMQGTQWARELHKPAMEATNSVHVLVEKLKKNDKEGALEALKAMKMKFHHLHHELMEVVSESHGAKHGNKHGQH
jgi:hypothetical protein